MKANFKTARDSKLENKISNEKNEDTMKDLSEQEFEEFIIKSGAAGSFMVFRSDKKDEEMGLDEI